MGFDWGSVASAVNPNSYDLISQIQTGYNQHQSEKQRDTQNALVEQSQKRAMRYEERLANTAHQREVEDLKAAGLNPVLSANAGAASPGAPSGGFGSANYSRAELAASSAQASLATANAIKSIQDGKISKADASVAQDIAKAQKMTAIYNAQTAKNNARVSGVDAEITDSKFGRVIEGTRRVSAAVAPLINAASGVVYTSARAGTPSVKYPSLRAKAQRAYDEN